MLHYTGILWSNFFIYGFERSCVVKMIRFRSICQNAWYNWTSELRPSTYCINTQNKGQYFWSAIRYRTYNIHRIMRLKYFCNNFTLVWYCSLENCIFSEIRYRWESRFRTAIIRKSLDERVEILRILCAKRCAIYIFRIQIEFMIRKRIIKWAINKILSLKLSEKKQTIFFFCIQSLSFFWSNISSISKDLSHQQSTHMSRKWWML